MEELKKVQEVKQWLKEIYNVIVYLESMAPVTFTINNMTYAIQQDEREVIFTIKLYGEEKDMRTYRINIRKKVEKYLNVLKSVNS